MPSSLIIVALAAAWLVVLVPMIARKRQEVEHTADSALAARVVRSGRSEEGGVAVMSREPESGGSDYRDSFDSSDSSREAEPVVETYAAPERIPASSERSERSERDSSSSRRRSGRGGFDPAIAEIAAKARYAYRQRVVLFLIIIAVATAVLAGMLLSALWWIHAIVDIGLVAYLGYLRKQVRIENDIRQRRLARYNNSGARPSRSVPDETDVERTQYFDTALAASETGHQPAGSERSPSPMSRVRRHAVVVDMDDEDPAFHELGEPLQESFRRASGE